MIFFFFDISFSFDIFHFFFFDWLWERWEVQSEARLRGEICAMKPDRNPCRWVARSARLSAVQRGDDKPAPLCKRCPADAPCLFFVHARFIWLCAAFDMIFLRAWYAHHDVCARAIIFDACWYFRCFLYYCWCKDIDANRWCSADILWYDIIDDFDASARGAACAGAFLSWLLLFVFSPDIIRYLCLYARKDKEHRSEETIYWYAKRLMMIRGANHAMRDMRAWCETQADLCYVDCWCVDPDFFFFFWCWCWGAIFVPLILFFFDVLMRARFYSLLIDYDGAHMKTRDMRVKAYEDMLRRVCMLLLICW